MANRYIKHKYKFMYIIFTIFVLLFSITQAHTYPYLSAYLGYILHNPKNPMHTWVYVDHLYVEWHRTLIRSFGLERNLYEYSNKSQ